MGNPLPPNLKITKDRMRQLQASLEALVKKEILVGFPQENTDRTDANGNPVPITNAALGYIHDQGAPEVNIPQREFMKPAIRDVQSTVTTMLGQIARKVVVNGEDEAFVETGLMRVGQKAEDAIKKKINDGVPPPLSDVTLQHRAARGRVDAMWALAWRAAGAPPGVDGLEKPLVDTGAMRNAVKYVIRLRSARSK